MGHGQGCRLQNPARNPLSQKKKKKNRNPLSQWNRITEIEPTNFRKDWSCSFKIYQTMLASGPYFIHKVS